MAEFADSQYPGERLDDALAAIRAAGLDCTAGTVMRGTVACTGNRGCRYAATDTKSHAVELANLLDTQFKIEQPVNLHVTGCPHSCAQHYIGDIGLLGTKIGGEEGYQVVIGGGSDQDQGLARELIPAIAFRELPPVMERLFSAYTEHRHADESFLEFSRRHSVEELKSFCAVWSMCSHGRKHSLHSRKCAIHGRATSMAQRLACRIIFASALPAAALAKPSHRIAVLYASQSGTAEGLARKLAKELKAQGHVPAVSTLVGYTPAALAEEKYALILASTYGDGDAPDGVQPFYEQLCPEHFPRFEGLSYAVLALGDQHYEHFCKFGKDLDAKLIALGANPLCDRVDCDVDVDEPFERWKSAVIPRLNEIAAGHKTTRPAVVPSSGNGETSVQAKVCPLPRTGGARCKFFSRQSVVSSIGRQKRPDS